MNTRPLVLPLAFAASLAAACRAYPGPDAIDPPSHDAGGREFAASQDAGAGARESKPKDDGGPSLFHVVLLYLPNRFLDLFDVARFGAEVGPGIGIDAAATDALRVGVMTRTSAGVGLQTLRHLPIKLDGQTYAGVGPIDLGGQGGFSWYRDPWDVRLEAQVLLAGGHAAVNIKEFADFVLGFLTVDIADDDL